MNGYDGYEIYKEFPEDYDFCLKKLSEKTTYLVML